MSLRYPPVSTFAQGVLAFLLKSPIRFSRPVSVEGERSLRTKRKVRRALVGVLAALVIVWGGFVGARRSGMWL